jgi:uncharacterized protein (DUF1684 family)
MRFFKIPLLITSLVFYSLAPGMAQTQQSMDSFVMRYKQDLYEIIKDDTSHISFFPYNDKYAVVAQVNILEGQKTFELLTSSGKKKEAKKYALLAFELDGKPMQLYAYQLLALLKNDSTSQHLFVPFTDDSNIEHSYGGGRYIDVSINDINEGTLQLDFNKAYNPYCAFTTGYNCPIPPVENSLPHVIEAGERYDAAYFSHD